MNELSELPFLVLSIIGEHCEDEGASVVKLSYLKRRLYRFCRECESFWKSIGHDSYEEYVFSHPLFRRFEIKSLNKRLDLVKNNYNYSFQTGEPCFEDVDSAVASLNCIRAASSACKNISYVLETFNNDYNKLIWEDFSFMVRSMKTYRMMNILCRGDKVRSAIVLNNFKLLFSCSFNERNCYELIIKFEANGKWNDLALSEEIMQGYDADLIEQKLQKQIQGFTVFEGVKSLRTMLAFLCLLCVGGFESISLECLYACLLHLSPQDGRYGMMIRHDFQRKEKPSNWVDFVNYDGECDVCGCWLDITLVCRECISVKKLKMDNDDGYGSCSDDY